MWRVPLVMGAKQVGWWVWGWLVVEWSRWLPRVEAEVEGQYKIRCFSHQQPLTCPDLDPLLSSLPWARCSLLHPPVPPTCPPLHLVLVHCQLGPGITN